MRPGRGGRSAVAFLVPCMAARAAAAGPHGVDPGVLSEDVRPKAERPPRDAPRIEPPLSSQDGAPSGAAETTFVYRDLELFASHPVVRSRRKNLRVGGALSVGESRSQLAGATEMDRLWTVSVRADHDRATESGAVSSMSATLFQGLDVWGAVGESRHGATPRFTVLELEGWHDRRFGDWAGGRTAVTVTVRGQAALGSRSLLSGAECYYGGRRFGAGLDSGTLSGDHCAMASVGLRWTRMVALSGTVGPGRLSLSGTVDGGWLGQKGALEAGEHRSSRASSGSLGARLALANGFHAELKVARVLSLPPGVPDPGAGFNVALGYRF